uniref:At1g61320/AtMIF1 LRR domain-containing protein n=1 Tax=Quercus lobata TaxID=97700 RepID=A0A7N2L6U6_QUELO
MEVLKHLVPKVLEPNGYEGRQQEKSGYSEKVKGLLYFCGKSLESRHKQRLTIREFIFTHGLDKWSLNSRVDCWINYVVKSDVKKLSLHFAAGYYDLPSVLVAKSITVLILRQCKLDANCGDINLPFLKKLSLSYVDADDKTIQKLVAGSPVIEDMKFLKCHGLKSIKFSGLIKAKSIEVELNDDLERLELEASNLCRVVISQTKQCEINLLSSNNVRMLTLSAPNITDKWLHNHFSQLPLIEYLSIYSRTLERLKISIHSLKTLYLMHWGSLIEVDIDTPNLCKFTYCGRNVIPFSSNALALSEVTYQMLKPPLDIAPWNVEKIEFLTKLGKSKQLTLTSTSAKDLVIPKKLRDSLPSPPYNVKQLKVEISQPRTGQEIVELVDSLLWISPLPEILIILHRINMEPWMTFKLQLGLVRAIAPSVAMALAEA